MPNNTYIIPVWDTITTAWDKVSGAKKTLWGAMLVFFVIMFSFAFTEGMFNEDHPGLAWTLHGVGNIIGYFLQMGLMYVGIRRAADMPIEFKQIFRVFEKDIALKMVLLYILQIAVFLPVILLVIPALLIANFSVAAPFALSIILFAASGLIILYLSIRMLISNALVLDKAIKPVEAIKLSFKATRHNFWPCVGLLLLQVMIVMVSTIPLGLGLIWTLPLVFICYGLMYKRLMVNIV